MSKRRSTINLKEQINDTRELLKGLPKDSYLNAIYNIKLDELLDKLQENKTDKP